MHRLPIFLIISIVFVVLYYFTPLRSTIDSQFQSDGQSENQQKADENQPFDKVSMELLLISEKMANLEGKARLLALAQEHPEWFAENDFAKLPQLISKTDQELADAKADYERIKIQYARETVTKMLNDPASAKGTAEPDAAAPEAH
ncbi:MAG TPA: hypothetical protein PKM59_01185 [Thermodesulfobacteriota bacterium]|nr:hypothetical protein [Deltaproteobacteria bacterium]HNR11907.1 hypothetical protein [Thermodesulfobacteriota bacterium]HNU70430.1 hypothetical protein [Thermodesulfobacteriota bacterium]